MTAQMPSSASHIKTTESLICSHLDPNGDPPALKESKETRLEAQHTFLHCNTRPATALAIYPATPIPHEMTRDGDAAAGVKDSSPAHKVCPTFSICTLSSSMC
jgi:hypothetical protein